MRDLSEITCPSPGNLNNFAVNRLCGFVHSLQCVEDTGVRKTHCKLGYIPAKTTDITTAVFVHLPYLSTNILTLFLCEIHGFAHKTCYST